MSTRDSATPRRKKSVNPRTHQYIEPELLPNLKKYKYSGADYSILSNSVGQPYWNFVVSLVPMKIAPNVITLSGFVGGMASFFVVAFYTFFCNGEYPSWVWLFCAASLFTYQTLDAIDGKQARRTGSGSPLGELFDHGCDAFLTPFVQVNLAVATKMSPPMFFTFLLTSSLGLFSAIYEQYCTGIFDLGYISGPTEGIILSCTLFIISGVFSRDVFERVVVGPFDVTVPAALTAPFTTAPVTVTIGTLQSVLVTIFFSSWLLTTLANYAHALTRPCAHASRFTPLKALVPTVVITVMHVALYVLYPDVQAAYPFAFELSFGLLMSVTVTRLTISRLSVGKYRPFSFFYVVTFVVTLAAIVVHYTGVGDVPVDSIKQVIGYGMYVVTGLGVLSYGHMIVSVFRQVAGYLGIHIFSINPKKTD